MCLKVSVCMGERERGGEDSMTLDYHSEHIYIQLFTVQSMARHTN